MTNSFSSFDPQARVLYSLLGVMEPPFIHFYTCSPKFNIISFLVPYRVATKVGFHNFAKYKMSRNTLLISRNSAKFHKIYRYEFREISARNLISRNSAKFTGTNLAKFWQGIKFCEIDRYEFHKISARNLISLNSAKFIGTNFAKFRQGI